jgi:hypothetical protein
MRLRRQRARKPVEVQPPATVDDDQRYEHRARAGKPDTPDEPGVCRVGDDDLVAVIDRRKQRAQQARQGPPVTTTSASGS